MTMIYTQDSEEMLKNANIVKEALLYSLEREGLLKLPAKEIGEKYAVILHKRGWLGALWVKWFEGEEKPIMKCDVVKIV